ncbi:MAG: hypothetical protein JHC19_02035 [Desulfurococcaceae archaeon]|nr:hypothetical protein [Desulfurococcaceae archaeon]
MKNIVVIGVPRTEGLIRSFAENYLYKLFNLSDVLLIPLPEGLCKDLVSRSLSEESYDPMISLRYLNASLERIWRPVLQMIMRFGRESFLWSRGLYCYLKDDFIKTLEERAVSLGYLLFKANVYGKIDVDEWIFLFRGSEEKFDWRAYIDDLRESFEKMIIVSDSYRDLYEMKTSLSDYDLCVLSEFYPNPLEALDVLINIFRTSDKNIIRNMILWAVDYLNRIKTSYSFDDLYEYYKRSFEYKSFIKRLGLEIFEVSCENLVGS